MKKIKNMNKTSKIIVLIVALVVIFDLGILIYNSNRIVGNYDKYIVNVYKSNKKNVEDGINELLNTVEYKNLQKDEQVLSVGSLLRLYLEKERITGFNYNESNQLYTYDKLDGTTSGIMLKDLSTLFEEEETQE